MDEQTDRQTDMSMTAITGLCITSYAGCWHSVKIEEFHIISPYYIAADYRKLFA